MPEKITLAQVGPGILEWSVYDPACKTVLTSHAMSAEGRVLLIDPAPMDEPVLAAIRKLGSPASIFLTNGNHARASRKLAEKMQIPIAAPAAAVKELGFKPDVIVDGLPQIYGLHPIPLPGGGAGEHAYYHPQKKSLCVGDALIHLEGPGFAVLPDKYCLDAKTLKKSLLALLSLEIHTLLFAHGTALPKPGAQLKKLLQS